MDLPVASQALNYDNHLQAAQDIALFCFDKRQFIE